MTPAEKDQKENNAALELTKAEITQRVLAEEAYDYYWQETMVLHPKVKFADMPPIIRDAWYGIIKLISEKVAINKNLKDNNFSHGMMLHEAIAAGFSQEQVLFLKKYFTTLRNESGL